nr:tropomyosin-1-like [Aegilops tauschii subsp. strangulata]
MDTVAKKIQSAKSELDEAFTSLLAGFESAEVSELKRKLERTDEDLVLVNKRLDQAQDSAAAVETLRGELAQAKEQVTVSKAAADKVAADLTAEQAARLCFEEWVTEVEQELKDAAHKCES